MGHSDLFSTLGHLARGAGGMAMLAKQSGNPKQKGLGKIPHARIPVSVSKVGSSKLGHGALCHMNRIKNMDGSRNGGEGLKRVGM